MNILCRTAISRRMIVMTVRSTSFCVPFWITVAILSNGCLAPPILFPSTGGYGVVVDQDGHPLANAKVKAQWIPSRLVPFIADAESANVSVEPDGTWRFYKRKVEHMGISAYAPQGYEPWIDNKGIDLYSGQHVTNVVFQFHKIQPTQSPKESK